MNIYHYQIKAECLPSILEAVTDLIKKEEEDTQLIKHL